jgi:hypothetical protein
VQQTDPLRVVTHVPQLLVPFVEAGNPVELRFGDEATGLQTFDKRTSFTIARTAFALDPKTHMMRVEIDVPNAAQKLRPGMSGFAMIFDAGRALYIPRKALFQHQGDGRWSVYVLRDGKHRRVTVIAGPDTGSEVAILAGLDPNDQVVTNPTVRVDGKE